ncbi:diguanylate cyclase [Shewanella intestini]|uniref:diguanylate cyclase n=1 Tax=Shewanella intestini TaxID=2017544 RepID=A0ABS5I2Y7_9GAMM|nr:MULTISPECIES: diguanylate cyclase [Shewanella]MBR9728389.1 diguanylate cyclase [Shewanella intestini]MRG36731.1 diguanylate cyclase [Shewanella sp. XMDDZSB0408]
MKWRCCILMLLSGVSLLLVSMGSYAKSASFDPLDTIKLTKQGQQLFALFHQRETEPVKTLNSVEKFLSTVTDSSPPAYQALSLRIKHDILVNEGKLDAAEKVADEFVFLGAKSRKKWIVAEALTLKAILSARRGHAEVAYNLINQAVDLAEQTHYDRLLSRALNARGVLYSRRLKYEDAVKDYQRAISLVDSNASIGYLSKLYSNISVVYSRVKEWGKAIEYNMQAIDVALKSTHTSYEHLVVLYANASELMLEVNDLAQAELFNEKTTVVAEKSGNTKLIIHALWTQASLLMKQKQHLQAKPLVQRCLKLAKNMPDPMLYNQCLLGMGEIEFVLGELAPAQQHGQAALKAFEMIENKALALRSHQLLADIFQQTQEYPKAIHHLTEYYEGTQKVLFENREAQMFELQEKFENEINVEKIALLTAENNLKESTLERNKLREKFWLLLFVCIVMFSGWLFQRYRQHVQRIRRLSSSNKDLFNQSNIDALTNIYNRRYVEDVVIQSSASLSSPYFSVLMLDCDFFKRVNDTHGHDVGDEVLKACAMRLSGQIRDTDVLARWGGEEFIILLGLDSPTLPTEVLARMNQAIANKAMETTDVSIDMTVSIGATLPVTKKHLTSHWHELKISADKALYQAKAKGRNRAEVASTRVVS